jgi:hypothetical protein
VVALVLLSAGTTAALTHITALRAEWPEEADTYFLPSTHMLRLLSLGHPEVASDLVAARTNVYFGAQLTTRGAQRWLSKYTNTAIDLDPYFKRLYVPYAAMLIYSGQKITTDTLLEASGILERGIVVYPSDWEMYFHLGFNLLYELPQAAGSDDPRIPAWRERGVEALRRAALFEEGPPNWLPNLVARLLTKQGSDEIAIRHLEQAYAIATEEGRHQIRAKLANLNALTRAARMEQDRNKFRELWTSRYPYAPPAFSTITGTRRSRAVSF